MTLEVNFEVGTDVDLDQVQVFGDRCSSHASATCIGVASSRPATDANVVDCSGENPPSGKKGT